MGQEAGVTVTYRGGGSGGRRDKVVLFRPIETVPWSKRDELFVLLLRPLETAPWSKREELVSLLFGPIETVHVPRAKRNELYLLRRIGRCSIGLDFFCQVALLYSASAQKSTSLVLYSSPRVCG